MEKQTHPGPATPAETRRRPYERPAVSWQEDFHPYVYSSCNKTAGKCIGSKKS